jgi:IS5 family transposase
MTHQPSFAQAEFATKKKITRREKFLARMEALIPWAKLLAVIEPFYPKGERGRPPRRTGADAADLFPPAMVWPG